MDKPIFVVRSGRTVWGTQAKAGYRQGRPEATSPLTGGQGVHREVEPEGHVEKYRAVVDGGDSVTNRRSGGKVTRNLVERISIPLDW